MYENPNREKHIISHAHDFGAGGLTDSLIIGPKGKRGRLVDIELFNITEAFTADTTPGYVRVGTSGDADAYAEMSCGTAAIKAAYRASQNDTDAIINADLPADTAIYVDLVAPTGGMPAGIAGVAVVIDWA